MKKLGIYFGDNDFGATFLPLLNSFICKTTTRVGSMVLDFNVKLPNDRVLICEIINNLSPMYYVLTQNQFEYNGLKKSFETKDFESVEDFRSTSNYLMIKPAHLYVDDEVDEFINNKDNFRNGEFFYVDFIKNIVSVY
jgi:hypothetical protein